MGDSLSSKALMHQGGKGQRKALKAHHLLDTSSLMEWEPGGKGQDSRAFSGRPLGGFQPLVSSELPLPHLHPSRQDKRIRCSKQIRGGTMKTPAAPYANHHLEMRPHFRLEVNQAHIQEIPITRRKLLTVSTPWRRRGRWPEGQKQKTKWSF